MLRGLVLALVVVLGAHSAAVQTLGILRIKVVFVDSQGQAIPLPRHRLQISDNPASAVPRRVMTSTDGTVDVRLSPGSYTVESERPVMFDGKAYQWTIIVDVAGGRDAVLELSGKNADIVDAPGPNASRIEADASSLLAKWQDSLVTIWTETAHGSGFLIDATGLIATDAHVIGAATSVEVQLSPTVKVAGAVIATDLMRGIALARIHPSVAAAAKALPIACDQAPEPLAVGHEVMALEAPLGRRDSSDGFVDSVLANFVDADLGSTAGASGGPAFASTGQLIGLTVLVPERGAEPSRKRILRIGRACELIVSSAGMIAAATPPSAAQLPVEPAGRFPTDSVETAAAGRAANPSLYRMSTSDFDVRFITPVQLAASQSLPDFSNWSEYVETTPPVLLIRVTPKFAEGFWTRVGRAAAMTQGMSIPAIKRPKGDFGRMRALCGDTEVVPVHPFKLEHRLTPKDTLVEGLYAFRPDALTPSCSTVRLQLFSEKQPRKPDTLVVDAKVIQLIWKDMTPYR
jgi:hypothetical protein